MRGHATSSDERRANDERPEEQVDEKPPTDNWTQPQDGTLQQGGSGSELPAGKPLGDDVFKERSEHDCPEHGNTEIHPSEGTTRKVSRPYASGREHESGADESEERGSGARRLSVHQGEYLSGK